jgi:hypothetical protein
MQKKLMSRNAWDLMKKKYPGFLLNMKKNGKR